MKKSLFITTMLSVSALSANAAMTAFEATYGTASQVGTYSTGFKEAANSGYADIAKGALDTAGVVTLGNMATGGQTGNGGNNTIWVRGGLAYSGTQNYMLGTAVNGFSGNMRQGSNSNVWVAQSTTASNMHYLEFTITANAGETLTINSLSFDLGFVIGRDAVPVISGESMSLIGGAFVAVNGSSSFTKIGTDVTATATAVISGSATTVGQANTSFNTNLNWAAVSGGSDVSSVTIRIALGQTGTSKSGDGAGIIYAVGNIHANGTAGVQDVIPEPTTATLSLLGLGVLALRRRRAKCILNVFQEKNVCI